MRSATLAGTLTSNDQSILKRYFNIQAAIFLWCSVRFLHICRLVGLSPAVEHVNRCKIRILIFRPHEKAAILLVLALCFEKPITSDIQALLRALMFVIWPANHNFSWDRNIKIRILDRFTSSTLGDKPTSLQMCDLTYRAAKQKCGRYIEIALQVAMIIWRRRSGQCGRSHQI